MSVNVLKKRAAKSEIVNLLKDKVPDSIRIMRVHEILSKRGYNTEDIDTAISDLIKTGIIKKKNPPTSPQMAENIKLAVASREAIELANYSGIPIDGERIIGDSSVVKFLPYATLSAAEMNEVTDVLVEKIDELSESFDQRIQQETTRIYRQMIGIFGVFVSIFSIIVIATDKMLRFNPEVLQQDWLMLLGKSAALFIPVGVVILALVAVTSRISRDTRTYRKKRK